MTAPDARLVVGVVCHHPDGPDACEGCPHFHNPEQHRQCSYAARASQLGTVGERGTFANPSPDVDPNLFSQPGTVSREAVAWSQRPDVFPDSNEPEYTYVSRVKSGAYPFPLFSLSIPANGRQTVSEFKNELGNTIRITIEGPTSKSTNDLTPLETAQLSETLTRHFARAANGREALDNSQSLLVMIHHLWPEKEKLNTEGAERMLVEQIAENRAALSALSVKEDATVSDEDWQRALDCALSTLRPPFHISRSAFDNAMQHAFGLLALRKIALTADDGAKS